METIEIRHVNFTYPNQTKPALSDIDLTVKGGEFAVLCGRSGCGKTTLLRLIKPLLAPHGTLSGELFMGGRPIHTLTEREQCEKIGFVLQDPDAGIVTDKVWHELAFGLENLGLPDSEIRARVAETAAFFGIEPLFYRKTNELSGGQKQLLNLASVMTMRPSVLLLDEPTSHLDPIAAQRFLDTLLRLNRELGTTVLLAEHRLEEVFCLADRVLVLDKGALIAGSSPRAVGIDLCVKHHPVKEMLPAAVRVSQAVHTGDPCPVTVQEGKAYLKTMHEQGKVGTFTPDPTTVHDTAPSVSLKDVWFRYEKDGADVLKGTSLTVRQGEMYALMGGNGAGKSTLLSLVAGALAPQRGKITTQAKTALLPQDPCLLFRRKTVREELEEMKRNDERVQNIIKLCRLTALTHRHPYDLSGGEKQRVGLAKILLTDADILLLDEPTKGQDAVCKKELAAILKNLCRQGKTVLLVSHDIEFCARFCDRCGMLFDGQVLSENTPRLFFGGNTFYTTAAHRMAQPILPDAILTEDILKALGIAPPPPPPVEEESAPDTYGTPPARKREKGSLWSLLIFAAVLLSSFLITRSEILHTVVAFVGFTGTILCLTNTRASYVTITPAEPNKKGTLLALFWIAIAVPLTIYVGRHFFRDRTYYFIGILIILETLLAFLSAFEKRKPHARELVTVSVLCALCVAGRTAFYMTEHFKPVIAIVTVSGAALGAPAGFLVGAISAFVSNFFFGQGPWTPWQMFSFGIIGFLAGLLFSHKKMKLTRPTLCLFGGAAALLVYGGIMNPAALFMEVSSPTPAMLLTYYASGFPLDLVHAASTVIFLWLLALPMLEELERIKQKYGLMEK